MRIALKVWPGIWRHPEWIVDQFLLHLERRGCETLQQAVAAVCRAQGWDFQIDPSTARVVLVEVQNRRFEPQTHHFPHFPNVSIHGQDQTEARGHAAHSNAQPNPPEPGRGGVRAAAQPV